MSPDDAQAPPLLTDRRPPAEPQVQRGSSKRRGWRLLLLGLALVALSITASATSRRGSNASGSTSVLPVPATSTPATTTPIQTSPSAPDDLEPAETVIGEQASSPPTSKGSDEVAFGPAGPSDRFDLFGFLTALGGLGGFGSMLTGVVRLITSGRGDPEHEDAVSQAPPGPTPGYL